MPLSAAALTFLFGLGFIGMEIYEFHHLIVEGFVRIAVASCLASLRWSVPNGLHVTSGLIWMLNEFQISNVA